MLPGLSTQQIASLKRRGVRTRAHLAQRLKKHGKDDPLIAGLPALARAALIYRPKECMSIARAKIIGNKLRECLTSSQVRKNCNLAKRMVIVGSVRRGKELTKDLDLLLVLPNSCKEVPGILENMTIKPSCRGSIEILESYTRGPRRRSFIVRAAGEPRKGKPTKANYRVDVFLAYDDEKAFALFHLTGSRAYNIRIRAYAKRMRGWKLNQYGLFDMKTAASGKEKKVPGSAKIRTEAELARFLGVSFRTPENRLR